LSVEDGKAPKRAPLAEWRNALRDAEELDRTALLVGLVISTYMDGNGRAYPSKATIASGCRLGSGRRAVDGAVDRLEKAGYLSIERSKGRRSFIYTATVPATSHGDATFTWHGGATLPGVNVADFDAQRRTKSTPTSHGGATESAESAESVSTRATRAEKETARATARVKDEGLPSWDEQCRAAVKARMISPLPREAAS
jgi:hypothetical protein